VNRRRALLGTLALPFLCATTTRAQSPPMIADSLRSRIDTLVDGVRSRNAVAGAVVAVVEDGRVAHLRGYGMVNRDESRAVDPELTTFGLSSISKVFTAIAVLRLVEQGQLSLDDAVHRHVPLEPLETAWGRRVQVGHLLTHAGGFDERTIGIAARTPADIVPLGEYLARDLPPIVREPGQTASYSNHGFALAGLLVEHVAGEPFARHLRRHVLEPLGMRSSGFEQPLPAELERARALPYRHGRPELVPRIFFNDPPAAALYSTGGDMARFMAAFLGDSSSSLGTVLRSTAPMRERQLMHHPALNGLTYGFRERRDAGVRGLQQGGDWDDYTSDLILAPTPRRGVFVAMSGDGASALADSIWRLLLAQPTVARDGVEMKSGEMLADSDVASDSRDPAGTYRLNRHSRHTLARMGVLTGAIGEASVTRRGGRWLLGDSELTPAGPALYHRAGGSDVAFRFDADGRATHLFTGGAPYVAYERVRWYERRGLHLALLGMTFAILVGTLWRAAVKWPLSPPGTDRTLVVWRWAMTAAAAGGTWLVVGLGAVLLAVSLNDFQYGTPLALRVVLAGGFVCGAGAAVAVVTGIVAALRPRDDLRQRLGRLGLSLAAGVFAALVYYWRLLPPYA
jgi:CubicO group peptidase (beta-lactamase class C family)